MAVLKSDIYAREPQAYVHGIPVFSDDDRYTDNYKKIASDHVAAMEATGHNPFMDEGLWVELEQSTRVLIEKYIPDGARVLDVGVGLGRVLGEMSRLDRYGIDISHDYLQRAKEKGIDVAFARIEDMPYKAGFFDAILACDVLEHVIDLHACCLQLMRVLKPGGVLIVRVPYLDDMSAYLDDSLAYEFIHLRSFDVPSLRILFGKIHGMQYKEHTFVAPYLKDALFKIKLPPKSSKITNLARELTKNDFASKCLKFFSEKSFIGHMLRRAGFSIHPLWILREMTEVSHEDFRNFVYNLRQSNPELLTELLPDLVESLEVNVVFKKLG
jgi:SAM-dependent methyltransferase